MFHCPSGGAMEFIQICHMHLFRVEAPSNYELCEKFHKAYASLNNFPIHGETSNFVELSQRLFFFVAPVAFIQQSERQETGQRENRGGMQQGGVQAGGRTCDRCEDYRLCIYESPALTTALPQRRALIEKLQLSL